MKLHDLTPNTPEWLRARTKWRSASDAPSMMGESPYRTRTALLVEKATGVRKPVDAATQRIFDEGHASEERMRPVIEALYGIELKPQTVTDDGEWMSATLDGWYRRGGQS